MFTLFSSVVFLFKVQNFIHRRSNFELLPFDPEIERTLFRLKKVKVDTTNMEDQKSDRFSEGHSDQNEMPGIQEPMLGDCWRPMMKEDYSRIRH